VVSVLGSGAEGPGVQILSKITQNGGFLTEMFKK